MYSVVITDEAGARRSLGFSKPELTIGRVQGNDIVLSKRNVSKEHARLTLDEDRAVVVDLNSTNGTWVNGRKINAAHVLKQGDKIYIADFIITVEPDNGDPERASSALRVSEPPPLPAQGSMPSGSRAPGSRDFLATSLPPSIESRETDAPRASSKTQAGRPIADPLDALLSRLAKRMDIENLDPAEMKNQERWSAARAAIAETFLAMQTDGLVNADVDMRQVAHLALHEAVGLGALDDVLSNESVRTVMVNGAEHVFVDAGEGLQAVPLKFSSRAALQRVAARLAAQSGQTLGTQPILNGRLSFGPKLTILQPPLVLRGPVIEIRVGGSKSLEQLAEAGWMSKDVSTYLAKSIAECRNVVVTGPRGSGVSELMTALARELPESDGAVVIETAADLDVDRDRVVSITAAGAGLSLTEAIRHGSRLRTEHLIIHDLSGAEVMTALSAVLGREPGHLLGVHGWGGKDPIEGLMLAARSDGADRASVAHAIGSAVDLVVSTERGSQGPRLSGIFEVSGSEAGDLSYQSVPF